MQRLTALFLTIFSLISLQAFAQESVQDWSKKVIELQEKEGQSFEQDIQLAKGFIYLQRRAEALGLLNKLMKSSSKKDQRLQELYETASDQFFFQETAETYAELVQFIKQEAWGEAKDKVEAGLQKENRHRLLTMRAIQLGLVLTQKDLITENLKFAEQNFADQLVMKTYSAWIAINNKDTKDAVRFLSGLWNTDKKQFENTELLMLAYLEALELTKKAADWIQISKIIQKHPEWVSVRVWRLKNKNFSIQDRKREVDSLKLIFSDLKKIKSQHEAEEKLNNYFYLGVISPEKAKAQFDELMKQTETQ
jgi:hypothetical protein